MPWSLEYGHRPSSSSNISLDLRLLNPFAEDVFPDESPNSEEGHDILRKPSLRRGSFHKEPSRHAGSQIDAYAGSNLHPLRSAGLAPGSNDAGVTRPHLSRVLNVGTLVDAPPVVGGHDTASHVQERDVLVHQISPGDSLAGVSLKYGISLAELRRANHLWTSDSIHLRTELYVPIDKASRLTAVPVDSLISITPEEELASPMNSDSTHAEAHDSLTLRRPSDADTIRRVPASQLSFFPPSVAKPAASRQSYSDEHTQTTSTTTHHTRYTSHPSNSLTSLFTSLPIAAFTRDTIIARLSFDSVSSSYSDRNTEGDSHELDEVSVGSTSSDHHGVDTEPPPTARALATPKATHYTPSFSKRSRSPPSLSAVHVMHLSSSPRSYIPSLPEIRTVQMEPSPEMQIPLLPRKQTVPKGKTPSRTNLLDADIGLENAV
ncbi:hypothetical protein C0991_004686 [Blastosporella zonata]|nr:hypothetical protein C0991_004686 [Blastosporella zonata]